MRPQQAWTLKAPNPCDFPPVSPPPAQVCATPLARISHHERILGRAPGRAGLQPRRYRAILIISESRAPRSLRRQAARGAGPTEGGGRGFGGAEAPPFRIRGEKSGLGSGDEHQAFRGRCPRLLSCALSRHEKPTSFSGVARRVHCGTTACGGALPETLGCESRRAFEWNQFATLS